jgi:uncharacterized protein YndB with AHSA1/START domain
VEYYIDMTDVHGEPGGISDEKVKAATGRTWVEWFEILDVAGAMKLPHKQIASWLYDNHLPKGWWCQSIAVAYEKARGLRILGQTADAGFELGAQKTFPLTPTQLWDFAFSPAGLEVWLGKTTDFQLTLKSSYSTEDGTRGEVRTIDSGKRLRMTWQPADWETSSTLQLYFTPTKTGTALGFHHEKLTDQAVRTQMLKHWKKVLETFEKQLLV